VKLTKAQFLKIASEIIVINQAEMGVLLPEEIN
jgi:hypothetical protein